MRSNIFQLSKAEFSKFMYNIFPFQTESKLKRINVIQKFICGLTHGQLVSYIGLPQDCLI